MKEISPAFAGAVPVVFACDANYLPYMAVAARSVIDNASPGRHYDIILLQSGIPAERLALFTGMAEGLDNVSVRAADVAGLIDEGELYIGGRGKFSTAAYYRLIIPWLLTGYDRAIYLDSDTLLRRDVAELFDTELGDALMGAVRDIFCVGQMRRPQCAKDRLHLECIGAENVEDYFNSGVLLMNLAALRRTAGADGLPSLAASRPWPFHDQDALNVFCRGRTRFLDMRWNYMRAGESVPIAPEYMISEWRDSGRDPGVVHFTGDRPWIYPQTAFGNEFWHTAARTPFCDDLTERLCLDIEAQYMRDDLKYELERQFAQGRVGFRYIMRYARAWARFKLSGGRGQRREIQ